MSARWVRSLLVVLVLFSFGLSSAHAAKSKAKTKAKEAPPPAAVETESAGLPPAELSVGFQVRDSETEGLGDLLVPVWNPGGTGLLFLNPRTAIVDHDEQEGNLGIGYRQLLPRLDVILGANLYYDYRDTGSFNYDQWGFGLELLSPWIDARANYYDPDDKRNVVASETQTTVSQTVRTSSDWRDPYAVDHYVLQDLVTTRTLTTATTTKTFEQYEQALGGYDWEIGLRLPIKSDDVEARVFGGYYDFDRDFGDDARGWKTRAELRVRSSLFLDAGLYENEDLTGSDWFAGARWSTPLDLGRLARGRNPFGAAKARLRGEPRAASARLTEMVLRDPQVRLEQSKFLENKALQQDDSSSSRSSSSQAYVVLPDVQFVDGDAGAAGDGTAERPFTTIQQGANAVYGSRNVYVYNASGPYRENVVLLPDTTLWGSGSLIPGYGGAAFGSGIHPVVDGLSLGPAVTMANRTTVRGMSVRNTDQGGPDQMIILPGLPTYNIRRVGIYGDDATDLTLLDNVAQNNEIGVLLARSGDFNLAYRNNLAVQNDLDGMEIWATGNGGGLFNADVSGSVFNDNGASGFLLYADGYDGSFVRIQDSQAMDNPGNGILSSQQNSSFTMALLSGLNAHGNVIGIQNIQNNVDFALANLSGSAANDNLAFGIQNVQNARLVSVGVIGMPDGLDTLAGGLASLIGFPLPAEVGQFLAPSGPVTANDNNVFGVQSVVTAENGLALGALFDVVANGNGVFGIQAIHQSPNGIAVGLAGSSQNLAEILQLGENAAGLFGLDLALSLPGGGHMEANGNGAGGFMMQTSGSNAAINAVVGLETLGNGGFGTMLGTYSDNLSIAALARLRTAENVGAGLLFDVYGLDDAAIGILADVFADVNGDSGITASVDSPDGSAVLLSLSTDVLRPLAGPLGEMFLGAPLDVPGEPFGPVVASGNVGNGFTANVTGDGFAAGVFLDTWADGNSSNGLEIAVVATNGPSIAAILSSDVALNLVNDMGVLPEPIAFDPLGYVSASGNGVNGIALTQSGTSGAYGILAGIRADDNVLGDGIHAELTSDAGDAYAILVDADADGNGDDGIDLTLAANGYAISALLFSDMDDNVDDGLHLVQNSATADAFALLANTEAWNNGGVGFWADLTAPNGDAAICATDVEANFNGGRGARFTVAAGDDAALLVGTNALSLFDMEFSGFLGADILSTFWDVIPQGAAEFSNNGAGGLYADLTSTGGNVWLDVDGAEASHNGNNGFILTLNALAGDVFSAFRRTTADDNVNSGVNLTLAGAGSTATAWFDAVGTSGNGGNGITVEDTYTGPVYVGGEYLVSQNNGGNGVRLVLSGLGGVPVIDFGGGGDSDGQSSIFGNGNRDFRYNNGGGATVRAENNWWGTVAPVAGQFAGGIDYTPWLLTDPNAP